MTSAELIRMAINADITEADIKWVNPNTGEVRLQNHLSRFFGQKPKELTAKDRAYRQACDAGYTEADCRTFDESTGVVTMWSGRKFLTNGLTKSTVNS